MRREAFVDYCVKRLREFDPSNYGWEGLVFSYAFDSWERTDRALHLHLTPEIVFQLSGISELQTPVGKITIRPKEVVITPPGLPHTEFVRSGPFENIILFCRDGGISIHIARGEGRPQIIHGDYIETPSGVLISEGFELIMRRILKSPQDGIAYDQFSVLVRLIIAELQNYVPLAREQGHPKITEVKRWIRLEYDSPRLTVAYLAEKVQCAPDYLSHLFVRETGQRISEYILTVRLDHGRRLMKTFSLRINEIARLSGIPDSGYFTRVFKRRFGMTPKDYQRGLAREVPEPSPRCSGKPRVAL